MKPLPWSPSALDTFKTCPRQYQERYIIKAFPVEATPEMTAGTAVHAIFESRQRVGTPLPTDLATHETFMQKLEKLPGQAFCELKVGLSRDLGACGWDHPRIWFRAVIDYLKVDETNYYALIVDYKTGKPHQKLTQLACYALHTFLAYKEVNLIDARFYWTKTQTTTRKVWGRDEIDNLWTFVTDDLAQYVQAYKTDTWQPRPSGLCAGWCPKRDCEFWRPKRTFF